MNFRVRRFGIIAPSGAIPTTLDPSNLGIGITLSNGNLTASSPVSASGHGYQLSRSINSYIAGKFYSEYTFVTLSQATSIAFGIANSSLSTNAGFDSNLSGASFAGDTANEFYINSVSAGTAPTIGLVASSVAGVAVDLGAQLIWIRNTTSPTVWNAGGTANPATGVGGLSISAITGPYFAEVWMDTGHNQSTVTANFGGTVFAATAPSGFGNW